MNAWSVPGYTESRELGSGGSGRVVLAFHDATGVPVAVKYLSERLRGDRDFVHQFRAEARLLGDLTSPYVVGLYEYVEAPHGAAIVMELVDGIALRALLRREGPTGPEAALVVLKGSLLGLAAAHRTGVVHRDYKPENVLVAPDGTSTLVDFGIAAGQGSTPGVAGTPAYMAPEQWSGRPASPASDVYAATATFYECLTGRKPFRGENVAELALQHIEGRVPDEEAPEAVRPLIRRGMAKEPGERPPDAEAFVAELEEIAGAAYGPDWEERGRGRLAALAALLPLLLPSAGGQPAGTTARATTSLGGVGRGRGRPGPRAALTGAVALAVAIVLAVAAGAAEDGPLGTKAEAMATTVAEPGGGARPATPGEGAASPSGRASPGASPEDTAPDEAAPDPSGEATDGPGGSAAPPTGAPLPSSPGPATSPPAGKPTPTDPVAPTPTQTPVRVTSAVVSGLRQTSTSGAAATLDLATDGTGPVSVVVTWYTGDTQGELGTPDGSATFQRSGATRYSIALDHTFSQAESARAAAAACYWGVRATTEPAAADGGSSQQIQTRRCVVT